jgi:hypothetical protein
VATIWSETLGQKIIYGGDDLNAFEQMFRNFAQGWMAFDMRMMMRAFQRHARPLSLTLADLGGVSECIFHALPDMARNLYTVSARPGHERNLMRPYFAAYGCDRVAECHDRFWIPCGGSRLKLS